MNNEIKNKISVQIKKYKKLHNYRTYLETLKNFLEDELVVKHYDFITFDNIRTFINDDIKEKLFIEASDKNLIEKSFRMNTSSLLF